MEPAITKPAFGSPDEIDARLAAAEATGLIELKPISANLGVEVEGVDLKNALSPEQVAVVYDALIRHKVLVFKKIGLWIGYVQRPSFCEKVICHVSPDSRNQTILHPVRVLRVTGQFIPQSAILKVSSQH